MSRKRRGLAALCCLPLLLAGCGKAQTPELPETADKSAGAEEEIMALAEVSEELTAWSVYWDCTGDLDTLKNQAEQVDAVSLFAAYFQDGELVIPAETDRMKDKIRRKDSLKETTVYLSVVNDVKAGDKTTQKDTEILWEKLGTDKAAKAHAEELVQLAKENGYDGIEIDYEKIRSDLDLWQAFLGFEKHLLSLAESEDLKVRIILEPSTPAEKLKFPKGAEYVVMCYNLYGGGTEPGPKADDAFLKEVFETFRTLPNVSYALADGGYIWEDGSTKAAQYRGTEAEALAEQYGKTPERDPDSGALTFSYRENGTGKTVWYADGETLAHWAETLRELAGGAVKISLWRL